MGNSYIRDYQVNLLDNTFSNGLEKLKAIYYGLDHILNELTYEIETDNDKKTYNTLTTCYLSIEEIIKQNDKNFKENL